jgi:glycosyltransferase involved in cell wall biosynthesis
MKSEITVVINTYNEEENISDCIKSAKLLTEDVILIDTGSTDNTVSIAKKLGIITYDFPRSFYVEPSRKFGIEKAKGEWIFILDADERITKELAKEIKETLSDLPSGGDPSPAYGSIRMTENAKGGSRMTFFKIPRKNIFGGKKWLKYGGWYPDHQIRLIKKEAFIDWSEQIHSTPRIKGEIGFLKEPFLHLFHPNLTNMVSKTAIFEGIESDLLYKAGKTCKTRTFFRKFLGELNRRMFVSLGFLDGTIGIIEAIYQAYSKTITYLFLYEKNKKSCNS